MTGVFLTTLLYGIVGPIIGATAFSVYFIVLGLEKTDDITLVLNQSREPILLFFLFCHVAGGIQALFVGLVTGLAFWSKRWDSVLVPILAACVACFAFMFIAWIDLPQTSHGGANQIFLPQNALFPLFLHLVAAIGVWLLQLLTIKTIKQ